MSFARSHFWMAWCLCAVVGTAVGCGNASLQLDPGSVGSIVDSGGGNTGGDSGAGVVTGGETLTILRTVIEAPASASSSVSKSFQGSKADIPTASATCTLTTMSGTVLSTTISDADGHCDFQITPGSISDGETLLITATIDGTTLSLVTIVPTSPELGTTTSLGTTGPASSVVAQMIFTSCESASGRTVTSSDPAGCASANSDGSMSLPAMVNAMNQLRTISEDSGSTDTENASGAFGALLTNFRSAVRNGSGAQFLRTAIDDSNYASLKQTVLAAKSVLTDATLISNVDRGGDWGTIAKCLATWSNSEAGSVMASPALLRNMMKDGSAESGGLDFCKSSSGAKAVARMTSECGTQSGNAALYPLLKAASWASVESCNANVMGSAICNLAKGASDEGAQSVATGNATTLMSSVRENPLAFAGTTGTTVASRLLYMGAEGFFPSGTVFCRSNADCGSGKLCSITNTCVSDSMAVGSNLPLGELCDSDAKCASGNCSAMVSSGNRFCAPTNGFVPSASGSLPPPQHDMSLPPVEFEIGSCLAAPATEAVAPAVLATNPRCGTNGFPTNQTFRITFNQPMDSATINSSTISVVSQDGALDGTVSYSGTSALFTPAVALQNGFTYTLTASTGVKNTDGTALSTPFSCAMTTIQATPTNLTAVYDVVMMIKAGRIWGWGRNSYGQQGDGTVRDRNRPQPLPGFYGIQRVASGITHTLALKENGTVWAWGRNAYGQLGDGTTIEHIVPAVVPGLSGVSKVVASNNFSIALKSDGTVWTWGFNSSGQLGDNTINNSSTPLQVLGTGASGYLTGVSDIACGLTTCYALKSNGTVWSWGSGSLGRLGDGTVVSKKTPVQVVGVGNVGTLSGVSKISASGNHALALLGDGTVVGWGNNPNGQLGNGNLTLQSSPVVVTGLSGVSSISAGASHSLAVKNDGTAWGWGQGSTFGFSGNILSATQVAGIINIAAAGAGNGFSVFQKTDNTFKTIGSRLYGHSGDGTTILRNMTGYVQSAITGVTQLGGGGVGTLHALAPNSKWVAWGNNTDQALLSWTDPAFQVGWDTLIYPAFQGSPSPKYVASGTNHTLALMADGTVRAWGNNAYSALGDNTQTPHYNHTTTIAGLSNITQIDAGYYYSLALKDDGTVWTWGYNAFKQIGDGTVNRRGTPYQVAITNVVDAATSYHTLAVKDDGTVWGWGYNTYGQVGNGNTTDQVTPIQVPGLSGVRKVGIGVYHSVAVKTDGTVWAWGYNNAGSLGNGTWVNSGTPVQVSGLTNVTKVCKNVAASFSAVIKSDGTVWAWGDNTYGQLGCGDTANHNVPVQVLDVDGITPITNATDVECGSYQMVVLTQDGRVIQWGYDTTGAGMDPAGVSATSSTLQDVVWP